MDVFRRNPQGDWLFIPYGEGDDVELTSVGLTVPIAALYEDVFLVPSETPAHHQPDRED